MQQHHQRRNTLALSGAGDRDRGVALLLAFFLGWCGVHHFYLGNTLAGIMSVLFFWTGIPSLIGLVNLVQLAVMTPERFEQKYNGYAPGKEQDSVLDAHLNPYRLAEQRPEDVFDLNYTPQQTERFAELVQHLNHLTQMGTLKLMGAGGQATEVTLLTNPIAVGDQTLPTLTLQAPGISILFTPLQVIAKQGNRLGMASYSNLISAFSAIGSTHAQSDSSTPESPLAELLDNLFRGEQDYKQIKEEYHQHKKEIKQELKTHLNSLLQEGKTPSFLQQRKPIIVPLQDEAQITLSVPGLTLALSSPEESDLQAVYQALGNLKASL